MTFSCCQPRLDEDVQVALVLKLLCGFSVDEIASAFLITEWLICSGRRRRAGSSSHASAGVEELLSPGLFAFEGARWASSPKVVIRFRRSPWRMAQLGFVHAGGGAFPTFWTFAEGKRPIVVAWASGPAADRLRGRSAVALRRLAVAAFARAIGRAPAELAAMIDDVLVYPWADDPFARGAYAYVPVGSFAGSGAASSVLASPVARTLIFAGEATETTGHIGTVHGALLTGARAARQARAILIDH
jgi:monoamine oxidase